MGSSLSGLQETTLNCYYDTYHTSEKLGSCTSNNGTIAVNVYDFEDKYIAIEIACKKDLCNTKSTVNTVIIILFKYNVTNASVGTGRAGAMKLIDSLSFLTYTIIFSSTRVILHPLSRNIL